MYEETAAAADASGSEEHRGYESSREVIILAVSPLTLASRDDVMTPHERDRLTGNGGYRCRERPASPAGKPLMAAPLRHVCHEIRH